MNKISWWRTDFGKDEVRKIRESILHEHVSQGPVTAEFEASLAEVLGVPYVVATTSGSMALLMALLAAGIGPGDEVVVPNRTWIATAHAPLLLGAKVALVDVESEYPIMDVTQLERKITPRTKVIMPVHLNGRAAGMEEVSKIAACHQLRIIEDATQAFCSRNTKGLLGTQSDAGCFSLAIAKLISTGQGGFVVTRDKQVYKRLKMMRTHGVDDVIDVSYTDMGFNFRFTDIQASIGIAQLSNLPKRIAKIKAIYTRYRDAMHEFPFLKFIPVDIVRGELPIYIEVLCPERKKLMQFLADRDIQTRPFYPDLNHAAYFGSKERFPNSEVFGEQGLFLPCGPGQPLENVDRVIEALRAFGDSL
ncbi:MAG: DegT/DnrJ/EryC1/StrS family aminotransferase [Candidatus Omnitrophota bacterium]|nr:MAG: DegT/DnrJ/EryC1/StrS family aminotransferase [Candidatus Omnitrophota bacterium]